MGYPKERKEAVIKKMLPPNQISIVELARQEGISEATLYNWRTQARQSGRLLPNGAKTPKGWTSADKFSAVVETAAMNEAELSAYCRNRGLYTEQIQQWRQACEQANDWDHTQNQRLKSARKEDKHSINTLEKELKRKEKALAEAAALLVLQKKAQAIWGEEGE